MIPLLDYLCIVWYCMVDFIYLTLVSRETKTSEPSFSPTFSMTTPLGDFSILFEEVQQYLLHLRSKVLYPGLIIMGFEEFHYILGMGFMANNGASVDIANRVVWFELPREPTIVVYYQSESALLTYFFTVEIPEKRLEDDDVVCEFPDVF